MLGAGRAAAPSSGAARRIIHGARAVLIATSFTLLTPAIALAGAGLYEVALPPPDSGDVLKRCTSSSPTLCEHRDNYELTTPMVGQNERNSMILKAKGGTFAYTKDEHMWASFGYPEAKGYDRYRVEAAIGADGSGTLRNASGNFRFVPFLCFEPIVSSTTTLCNSAAAKAQGGETPPYDLNVLTPASELVYRARVGWRYIGTSGNRSPEPDRYKMSARLAWYGVDDTAPTISQRTPAPGATVAPSGVSAQVSDRGSGVRTAQLVVDGQPVVAVDGAGPHTTADDTADLAIEYAGTLAAGPHVASVLATDWAGRQSTVTWSFNVYGDVPADGGAPDLDELSLTIRASRQSIRSIRKRGLLATFRCSRSCSANLRLVAPRAIARRLRLGSGGAVTLGHIKGRTKGTRATNVRMKVSRRVGQALQRSRAVRLELRASAKDASGATTTARRGVTVVRR